MQDLTWHVSALLGFLGRFVSDRVNIEHSKESFQRQRHVLSRIITPDAHADDVETVDELEADRSAGDAAAGEDVGGRRHDADQWQNDVGQNRVLNIATDINTYVHASYLYTNRYSTCTLHVCALIRKYFKFSPSACVSRVKATDLERAEQRGVGQVRQDVTQQADTAHQASLRP